MDNTWYSIGDGLTATGYAMFCPTIPMKKDFAEDVEGPDIEFLEQHLKACGITNMKKDNYILDKNRAVNIRIKKNGTMFAYQTRITD